MISVIIPVGPFPANKRWLGEAIGSVANQLGNGDEILLVDDYAHLPEMQGCRIVHNPWRLGQVSSINIGVALAANDLVVYLGSDDKLLPGALNYCKATWERYRNDLGYYYMKLQYSDGREQNLPCMAAMVTKALWKHTGGLPIDASFGAPDAALISIIMGAHGEAGHLINIDSPNPIYWVRLHPDMDTTQTAGKYSGMILEMRNRLTSDWKAPEWTH